ncbi:MAG: hypothetical protein GF383_14285 [Candidatus Lokiarchaeota archaeon]|nr:hypothetical protein [Candidatus Lokiarchaeota archaeon]MBD3342536.1 hypothetical protein [Candidatus Lokiarchaeota archaeon]
MKDLSLVSGGIFKQKKCDFFKKKYYKKKNNVIRKMADMAANANFYDLKCEACDSQDVIQTREGYVCRDCGLVLETQVFQYHRPYEEERVQHAVLRGTTLGYTRERLRTTQSRQFNRLNKLNNIKDNQERTFMDASKEIGRIFARLNLPEAVRSYVETRVKAIWQKLNPGTKYRNPDKLVPLVIYFCCKIRKVSIKQKKLLDVAKISKNEFNAFKLQILEYYPEYVKRDKRGYVVQKIMEIRDHFGLDMEFYFLSKRILAKLWKLIYNTTEDVIAGVVTSIAALCCYQDELTVNAICKRLGIVMSTIQSQVKRRIFQTFKVPGFKSLVKSSNKLRKVMEKLKIVEPEERAERTKIREDIPIIEQEPNRREAQEKSKTKAENTTDIRYPEEFHKFCKEVVRHFSKDRIECEMLSYSSMSEGRLIFFIESNNSTPFLLVTVNDKRRSELRFLKVGKGPPYDSLV